MSLKSFSQDTTKVDSICFTVEEVKTIAKEKQKDKEKIDTLVHITDVQKEKIYLADKIILEQDTVIIDLKENLKLKDSIISDQNKLIQRKRRRTIGIGIASGLSIGGLFTFSILK